MYRLLPLALVGAVLAFVGLPRVDGTRGARNVDQALLFVPNPRQLRHVASGFEEPLADLFWLQTVLVFGEHYGTASSERWLEWLRRTIAAVYTLDPLWRTPYFYGGTLLRASGDVSGSDVVFQAGRENLPQDWFFPLSLGMNAYLYRSDPATAADLLAEAATRPGAPGWYAAAAAAMRQDAGDRRSAIRYLLEVRDSTTDPGVREDTERQLGRLLHNEVVDTWAAACRAWKAQYGRLERPEDLTKLGFTLPENPRGDAWIVGADGVVRSKGAEAERYRDLLREEFRLVGR